jgi:hypothetical protein
MRPWGEGPLCFARGSGRSRLACCGGPGPTAGRWPWHPPHQQTQPCRRRLATVSQATLSRVPRLSSAGMALKGRTLSTLGWVKTNTNGNEPL